MYQQCLLSKISWHLTIADIEKTLIKGTLDNFCHNRIHRWLEIPTNGTLDIVLPAKSKFGLNIIDMRYIFWIVGTWRYFEWEMNVRQTLSSEKRFLSPRQGSKPQPSDDRWDAPTIELPRLRWWAKVQVQHMCDLRGSHYLLIRWSMRYIFIYFIDIYLMMCVCIYIYIYIYDVYTYIIYIWCIYIIYIWCIYICIYMIYIWYIYIYTLLTYSGFCSGRTYVEFAP